MIVSAEVSDAKLLTNLALTSKSYWGILKILLRVGEMI